MRRLKSRKWTDNAAENPASRINAKSRSMLRPDVETPTGRRDDSLRGRFGDKGSAIIK